MLKEGMPLVKTETLYEEARNAGIIQAFYQFSVLGFMAS
jgi:hypothetical protein